MIADIHGPALAEQPYGSRLRLNLRAASAWRMHTVPCRRLVWHFGTLHGLQILSKKETFWEFSVRTYSQAGIADACLALQDEHGADVNLLLYCCWAGWHSAALDEAEFERALSFSQIWSGQVVRPLRSIRRWMKSDGCCDAMVDVKACMDLRESIKATELRAEKLQQAVLESLPRSVATGAEAGPGPEAVGANLRRDCRAAGIAWSEEVRSKLGVILRAAFPRERMPGLGD